MDTLVLLRRGNKIPTEGDTKTKCGAECEERTMQRLPYLVIHPIDSYKTHTIIDAHTYLMTRVRYSCHLGGSASA